MVSTSDYPTRTCRSACLRVQQSCHAEGEPPNVSTQFVFQLQYEVIIAGVWYKKVVLMFVVRKDCVWTADQHGLLMFIAWTTVPFNRQALHLDDIIQHTLRGMHISWEYPISICFWAFRMWLLCKAIAPSQLRLTKSLPLTSCYSYKV